MKFFCVSIIALCAAIGCTHEKTMQDHGLAYQQHGSIRSLRKVVALLPPLSDTSFVRELLGAPIDMGFDYRYLVDSKTKNGCPVGAVFHINGQGKIDQQWVGKICE